MTSRSTWTHGFKHLLNEKPFIPQKTSRRLALTPSSQRKGIPHPRDRIKFWNVHVGDKVGIFRGNYKPKEQRDRVFEVHDVDKKRNWVEIKDLPSKSRTLTAKSLARVHYSNVGLYMGKFPVANKVDGAVVTEEKDVFATRLITTEPKWDPWRGHFTWRRFAASTWPVIAGYEKQPYGKRRRARSSLLGRSALVEIPWPVQKRWQAPESSPELDTLAEDVEASTWEPATKGMVELGALEATSFPPSSNDVERAYLRASLDPALWAQLPSDLPVEVFLIRELANPHSRAKKQARWQERLAAEDALRTEIIHEEMKDLSGRKRAVARREAIFRWKARVEGEKKQRTQAAWVKRGGPEDQARNEKQSEKRAARKERKLRELVLPSGVQNQVIPRPSDAH